MKYQRIKLIIFDFNGVTVSGSYPETMKFFAKKYSGDWREMYEVFYTKYFNQAASGKMSLKEAWGKPLKEFHIPLTWKQAIHIHLKLQTLNQTVVRYVGSLRRRGYKCIVVSKNVKEYWKEYKRSMQFHHHFDEVINLQEYSLPKASAKMVHFLAKRYHVKPQEIISIDDQAQNLTIPKTLGVHTILYRNFKQMRREVTKILRRAANW